jgi:hypothetical protein
MSKRRYLIRSENASQLSGSEQEQFVDDVYSILDGEDIRGVFVTVDDWNWLDVEGERAEVESVVQQFKELEDVGTVEFEKTDDSSDWTVTDSWHGHGDDDAQRP